MFLWQRDLPRGSSGAPSSPWPTLLCAAVLLAVLCVQRACAAETDHASRATVAAAGVTGGSGVPTGFAMARDQLALEEVQGAHMSDYAEHEMGHVAEAEALSVRAETDHEVEYADDVDGKFSWFEDFSSEGAGRPLQMHRRSILQGCDP